MRDFGCSSMNCRARTGPVTTPLMTTCDTEIAPSILPFSLNTKVLGDSDSVTLPRTLPSTRKPPEKWMSPSILVSAPTKVSMRVDAFFRFLENICSLQLRVLIRQIQLLNNGRLTLSFLGQTQLYHWSTYIRRYNKASINPLIILEIYLDRLSCRDPVSQWNRHLFTILQELEPQIQITLDGAIMPPRLDQQDLIFILLR